MEARSLREPTEVWDLSIGPVAELLTPVPWVPAINGTWTGEGMAAPVADDPSLCGAIAWVFANMLLPEETCGAPAAVA